MKNLLIVLFLFSGLSATQLAAQSCCTPAPSCCVPASCCVEKPENGKAAKAGACSPEEMKKCTPEQLAACTSAGSGTAQGGSLSRIATSKSRKSASASLAKAATKNTGSAAPARN